jgi:hypothetical protein
LFVINYDENDGFFDHVVPPTPDREKYPEEFVTLASPAGTPGGGMPIGAGFRVPCFIISPWTVGGQIFSEVSDHTSCLQLIETVAAAGGLSGAGPVTFPNISRWRRATFSDFTAALRGAARPAPTNTQFDPATTAANLAAQYVAARQPQTARPGATQQFPREGHRKWPHTGRAAGPGNAGKPRGWPLLRRHSGVRAGRVMIAPMPASPSAALTNRASVDPVPLLRRTSAVPADCQSMRNPPAADNVPRRRLQRPGRNWRATGTHRVTR